MNNAHTEKTHQRDPKLVEKLIFAAEDVAARWSLVRGTDGKLGSCGLPTALAMLALALDDLDPEETDNG